MLCKEFCKESYQKGYEGAFAEMYSVSGNPDHSVACGDCRPCGVVQTVIEDVVQQLAAWMTEEEFLAFSGIVECVRERREEARGQKP